MPCIPRLLFTALLVLSACERRRDLAVGAGYSWTGPAGDPMAGHPSLPPPPTARGPFPYSGYPGPVGTTTAAAPSASSSPRAGAWTSPTLVPPFAPPGNPWPRMGDDNAPGPETPGGVRVRPAGRAPPPSSLPGAR